MFVITSLLLGASFGHFFDWRSMLVMIGFFVCAYAILHNTKLSGELVATACWFMLYFTIAMLLSGGITYLLS